VTTMSN